MKLKLKKMRKQIQILLIILISINTAFSQEKYAIIISEQFSFDDSKAIDKQWQKTFDVAYDFVYNQNISINNVYMFFCNGIDYHYPGIPDRYNAETIFMHPLTNYPAKIEYIKNFFQERDRDNYYLYDYPEINNSDSVFISIVSDAKSIESESLNLYQEDAISVDELELIISKINAKYKWEIKWKI